ncbi:MAG: NfeD family protein [Bacteroidia bacterium]
MLFTSIILLILFGILLLVLEILILPGLIAGIIGGILVLAGISWMYKEFGNTYGNYTAVTTALATFGAIYYSLKSKAWTRFGLKDSLEGKTNQVDKLELKEGDEGTTVSDLRPMGSVMINNIRVEAQSHGEHIPANSKITVLKILPNKLIVKKKTKP